MSKIVGIFVLGAVLFTAGASFAVDDAILDAIQYRIRGYDYQRQGDHVRAMQYYRKAIERYPYYACAHNDLGVLYEQTGQIKKAEEEYLKTIEIDPTYASAYTNLASLYEDAGRLESACYYWQMRSNMGSPLDQWTAHAKLKYKELSSILAEEEAMKRTAISRQPQKTEQTKPQPEKIIKRANVQPQPTAVKQQIPPDKTKTSAVKPLPSQTNFEEAAASNVAANLATEKTTKRDLKNKEVQEQLRLKEKCQVYIDRADSYNKRGNYDSAIRQYNKVKEIWPGYPHIDEYIQESQDAKIEKERQLKLKFQGKRQLEEDSRIETQRIQEQERLQIDQKKADRVKTQAMQKEQKQKDKEKPLKKPQEEQERIKPAAVKPSKKAPKTNIQPRGKDKGLKAVPKSVSQPATPLEKFKADAQEEKQQSEKRRLQKEVDGHVERCQKYISYGRYNLAMDEYKKIQKLDPEYAAGMDMDSLIEAGKKARAKKEADGYLNKAKSYYEAGKYEKAIPQLNRALEVDPNNAEAARMLKYCQRHTQEGYSAQQAAIQQVRSVRQAPVAPAAAAAPVAVKKPYVPPVAAAAPITVKEQPKSAKSAADISKEISREVEKESQAVPQDTGADIEKKYHIIGVVAYRSQTDDIGTLNEELLKKAKAMGAEEVIQVKYFQHNSFIYGYGTAVKKKK
jgi:tetratricopeptide (TPR) repeat protein